VQRSLGNARGFTLIELLIVITIMLLLTSFFLLRQQSFNSSTILRSLTYSVALSVRQAQVYGTSVRAFGVEFGGEFTAKSYGVHFINTQDDNYVLFADLNDNGQYDGGELVQAFELRQGYTINKFCGILASGGSEHCTDGGGLQTLSIYFRRPNPDAQFTPSPSPGGAYSSAYVLIASPTGNAARRVTVYPTGQIEVGTLESI